MWCARTLLCASLCAGCQQIKRTVDGGEGEEGSEGAMEARDAMEAMEAT
jgi:hypothetical protein